MAACFEKLPRQFLADREGRLFELCATHLSERVETPSHEVDLARLAAIPVQARIIYWLWQFYCEAGVCGMDVFILNSVGIYAPQIHAALVAIGAYGLAHRLEAAVAFAREGAAEFKKLDDQSWFNQFPLSDDFPNLQSINSSTAPLIDELIEKSSAFIRSNEKILFNEGGSGLR